MSTSFTVEQVLQLAPDAASAKAGESLSRRNHWVLLNRQESVVWGECQGSGKLPYQTQIDLTEPAFKCSCPSRKFPCKHGLGLMLLLARDASAFATAELAPWVAQWIESRRQRQEQRSEKAVAKVAAAVADPAAQQKRSAQRMARVAAGLEECSRWLGDLARTGLAAARAQPYGYWDGAASRLVDAQAPGMARRIRQLPQTLIGEGWQNRLLAELGGIHLLISGYQRLETLPAPLQADIRAAIGWNEDQAQLLLQDGVRAHWLVLAMHTEQEEQLRVRRTWLAAAATAAEHGQGAGKIALLIDFAVGNAAMPVAQAPGAVLDAELVFFPGFPQRALIKQTAGMVADGGSDQDFTGFTSSEALQAEFARVLAHNPWLERHGVILRQWRLQERQELWCLQGQDGGLIALSPKLGANLWLLLAHGGGQPLCLAGEWNGEFFLPLSLRANARWQALPTSEESA